MSKDQLKQKILKVIKETELAVLSTVDGDNKPESAAIVVSEDDDLNLYFGTFSYYRKYNNLKNNPRVALVIGWGSVTIQYEGVAIELTGKEMKSAVKRHVAKLPGSSKFVSLPEERFFKVTPKWIRYVDFSKDDIYGHVKELNF